MAIQTSIETFQNHMGYDLGYQLHLPDSMQRGDKPSRVMVYFGGFGSDMDSKYITCSMNEVLKADIAVVRFDATPVHRDPENPRNKTVETKMLTSEYYVRTAHAALKHTVDTYGKGDAPLIDADQISIAGISFGTIGAIKYAAHMNGLQKRILDEDPVPIAGMILQAPVLSLKPFWVTCLLGRLAWKNKDIIRVPIAGHMHDVCHDVYKEFQQVDVIRDFAPHVTCPVKTIYGDKDKLGCPSDIEALNKYLVQASSKEKNKIIGAGHFFEDVAFMSKLNKKKDKEILAMLKEGSPCHSRDDMVDRYLLENYHDITKMDEVINLSKDFLLSKVFAQPRRQVA